MTKKHTHKPKDDDDKKEPFFPFKKMPWQEKGESGEELEEFDLDSSQELDLGESELRNRRRTLDEERGAGHEP
jgi:hypothetical protein